MIEHILGNRYRILREVGSGGMAKVYLAEDMNEGQLAAVKVLYPHFGEDVSYIQRFSREAKLAEALNNPHIVKIMDYGSSRDTHYLVMEYVEGQDLRTILSERGPLPWDEALKLIDQVAEALEEANSHSIIHRDIKPQNVMITDGGLLKVLDFGIARSRALPSLTQSGFVGSPYYISPEQAMGDEVDIRSDIYSTGIVLYELLSGRVPFDAKSPWSIISQHITMEPPEIDIESANIPIPVQKLLKYMVAKNPDDRFQDPTTLRQAIISVLTGGDIPTDLGTPPPANMDKIAMAETLFHRAEEAINSQKWHKALSLLNQVIDLHPKHPQALAKRTEAGTQARLSALYRAALRALEARRWREAIDELTEVLEIDPDFQDAVKLLAQAQEAEEKASAAVELSDLYEQAMAYFEAEDYSQAETLFGRIREISPSYERADALWVESRRRNTKGDGFDRLNEELVPHPIVQPSEVTPVSRRRFQVKWLLITGILVVVIVGAVWGVSLGSGFPAAAGPTVDELYAQAQTALEANDLTSATDLTDQILSIEANHAATLNLQQQLQTITQQEEQLAQARTAIANAEWTAALEILKPLYENANSRDAEIGVLLCDTYLARGQERLANITNPRDQATVRAALADFQAGQQLCEAHDGLSLAIKLAANYLIALDQNVTVDDAIRSLEMIIQSSPDYAGGQVEQNLYLVYLKRGDILHQQRDFEAALTDYNAALALNVTDTTEAQRKQAQALAEVSTLNQSENTGNSGFRRGPVTLLAPETNSRFEGEFVEILLTWQAINLAQDEYYDITVRWFVGDEPRYWGGNSLSGEITCNNGQCAWQVPLEAGYGVAGKDEYSWWVTIRQVGTDAPLGPASEERIFIWKAG